MTEHNTNEKWEKIDAYLEAFAKGMESLRASQAQTDAQLRQTDVQLKKTIRKLDDIGRQLADQGLVQGEVAEELFYRNVRGMFRRLDVPVERVRRNVKVKGLGARHILFFLSLRLSVLAGPFYRANRIGVGSQ